MKKVTDRELIMFIESKSAKDQSYIWFNPFTASFIHKGKALDMNRADELSQKKLINHIETEKYNGAPFPKYELNETD